MGFFGGAGAGAGVEKEEEDGEAGEELCELCARWGSRVGECEQVAQVVERCEEVLEARCCREESSGREREKRDVNFIAIRGRDERGGGRT
jgi:hypothetical protein